MPKLKNWQWALLVAAVVTAPLSIWLTRDADFDWELWGGMTAVCFLVVLIVGYFVVWSIRRATGNLGLPRTARQRERQKAVSIWMGPIDTPGEAVKVIDDVSKGFYALAGIQLAVSIVLIFLGERQLPRLQISTRWFTQV